MTRAAYPAPTLVGALWAAGLGGLAAITLASPGATRMHVWPWSLAYAIALAAPAAIVILRAFDPVRPLVLPARGWLLTAILGAVGIVLSALASPYREQALLGSAPLLGGIAFFFAVFDAVHGTADTSEVRREKILGFTAAALALPAAVGLALWLSWWPEIGARAAIANRNAYPLGHSNYTAGIALLLLPVGLALASRASKRTFGLATTALAVALLFSSGSRGGVVGLAVLAGGGLLFLRWPWRKKLLLALALGAVGAAFIAANPRTRAMFERPDPAAAPNLSNVQRAAMFTAGWQMGRDRPLLGWGPGTTPLAFPRYRAGLDGGVENALQLHSAPAQLWAELGALGLAAALAVLVLVARSARTQPAAAITLAGYAAFSLFDWQLDVPVFTYTIAAFAALLAAPSDHAPSRITLSRTVGVFSLVALALVVLFGRRDPTPEINVRALALATTRSPDSEARAVALLRTSLALNPDQEITHFNLGWLLVTSEPVMAEKHFLSAAHLVPDKGGVYFGLGLARLNQGQRDPAAHAFALECVNDPAFATSPWWRDPAIAATRDATAAAFADFLRVATERVPRDSWAAAQIPRVVALASTLGRVPDGPERIYRRERTGYPVLMRNLNLPVPIDLFDVRELAPLVTSSASPSPLPSVSPSPVAPLPPKGWLPSPLLLTLLDTSIPSSPNRESKIENRK